MKLTAALNKFILKSCFDIIKICASSLIIFVIIATGVVGRLLYNIYTLVMLVRSQIRIIMSWVLKIKIYCFIFCINLSD